MIETGDQVVYSTVNASVNAVLGFSNGEPRTRRMEISWRMSMVSRAALRFVSSAAGMMGRLKGDLGWALSQVVLVGHTESVVVVRNTM